MWKQNKKIDKYYSSSLEVSEGLNSVETHILNKFFQSSSISFQKDLIVWKLWMIGDAKMDIGTVSEGLNSVETIKQKEI